jgi:hypothetical protein
MFFSVVVRFFLFRIQISSILEKWLPAKESRPLAGVCRRPVEARNHPRWLDREVAAGESE